MVSLQIQQSIGLTYKQLNSSIQPHVYTRPSSQLRSADQTHRHPFQWSFRCLDVFGQKNMMDLSLVSNHLWFAWMPVLLTPPLAPWRPNLFKYSFLLAKQSYDWRRKGSAVSLLCLGSIAQRHTTGAARVGGKKVVQQHVPQHVFVPHVRQYFGLQTNYCFVWMLSWKGGRWE